MCEIIKTERKVSALETGSIIGVITPFIRYTLKTTFKVITKEKAMHACVISITSF